MAGCSRDAVLKWINEGKVKAIKVGGKFRIWQPTLQQHLRQDG
jgi:excisionase family DNA binding protein